jgi:hypothetical protein
MGCDYYTYVITRLQYTDAQGRTRKFDEQGESERHYYYGGDSEYDPDLEADISFGDCIGAVIDRERREYGEKDLFIGGEWKCQPAGKERILALCTSKKIPIEALVRVYKFKSGHMR